MPEDGKQHSPANKFARPIIWPLFWLRLFRMAVATAVIFALVFVVRGSVEQIRESDIWLSRINFGRLGLAMLAYTGAMLLSALFWRTVLISFGHRPGLMKSLAAFFVSQFGKYVPGKAMVIIIRSDMIRDDKLSAAHAAASVVIETLTWIFVGSVLASILAYSQFQGQPVLQWTTLGLAVVTGILTFPPVVNFLMSRFIRNPERNSPFSGLKMHTLLIGWAMMTAGWCLNALSLWLVVDSIPGAEPAATDFWLMLTCVALAMVLGFVSLIPAGIGVRELAIIPMLTPEFGSPTAIFAAVIIRLVWLSAILTGSAIIYVIQKIIEKTRVQGS